MATAYRISGKPIGDWLAALYGRLAEDAWQRMMRRDYAWEPLYIVGDLGADSIYRDLRVSTDDDGELLSDRLSTAMTRDQLYWAIKDQLCRLPILPPELFD